MERQRVAAAGSMRIQTLLHDEHFTSLTLCHKDDRKMALFAQYAMACTEEALKDAKWNPQSKEDLEATVGVTSSRLARIMLM